MRITKLSLNKYKRFEKEDICLDGRVLAIIGPNEAGKSSLFAALLELDRDGPIPRTDITRGLVNRIQQDEVCISGRYLLNDEERLLAKTPFSTVEPRWYVYEKQFDGGILHFLEPEPIRDVSKRSALAEGLKRLAESTVLEEVLGSVEENGGEGTSYDVPLVMHNFESTAGRLSQLGGDLDEEIMAVLSDLPGSLKKLGEEVPDTGLRSELEQLAILANDCLLSERLTNPYVSLLERFSEKRPKAYLFDWEERQLKPEYPVAELKDPSPAFRNLLALAGFTTAELAQVVEDGDHAQRAGLTIQINEGLKKKFTAAWQQSAVHPYFEFAADVLRLHVGKGSSFTPILERSEGLRTFVALWTFIAIKNSGEKPILLIDEAESHLHYDAQADLVRVLYEQDDAEQLFYSTHSAGCLPHDLGTAVRVVRPRYDEQKADTGRSEIYRSFWTDPKPGFSPLMFAIGASAFSIIPTRRVVLAEGPADCILLPSLMREATGLRDLDFQVAPGLANVAPRDLPDLEMEAPKVAFIVDGDEGGRAIAKKLRVGGYSNEQIASLEAEFVLEDYVSRTVYAKAVNECVRRSHGLSQELSPDQLPEKGRTAFIKSWCTGQGIGEPNRVAVAEKIVDARDKAPLLDPNRKADLVRCHSLVEQILSKRKAS